MCSTAEESLYWRAVLAHFRFKANTTLFCESLAARGIAQRARLGKVKALAVKTSWLQEIVRGRALQVKVVYSKAIKTDLGTKVLSVDMLNALRAPCGIVNSGASTE